MKTQHLMLVKTIRGAAAVEMALVTLLLVTASLGAAELARAIYYYDNIAKNVRSAARYLAQRDSNIPANQLTFRTQARNIAVCGLVDCANATSAVPGLTIANVSVSTSDTSALLANVPVSIGGGPSYGTLDLVVVTIGAPASPFLFTSLAPFVIPSISFPPISVAMAKPL
jgi:Flp pilus assembly protein TadG